MNSILNSIKKKLGVSEDDENFDIDLIMDINSAFSILTQMGVGPSGGFSIDDSVAQWSDFIDDQTAVNLVKNYIFMRVKLMFDSSSASSTVIDTLKNEIAMYEWRLNTYCDT